MRRQYLRGLVPYSAPSASYLGRLNDVLYMYSPWEGGLFGGWIFNFLFIRFLFLSFLDTHVSILYLRELYKSNQSVNQSINHIFNP